MHNRRSFIKGAAALSTIALAPAAFAGGHGRLGTFKGTNNHITTGTVEVLKDKVVLLDDFTFDGAPDPKVAFGKDGYDANTLMGPLTSNTGSSTYEIPAGINPEDYNEVWIWCERFNVSLGVAKLG